MRMHYSKDADAVYIRLKESNIINTDSINDDIIIDYDSAGNVVGIEILFVSEKADIKELVVQSFDMVKVEPARVA